jgi:hypothetical protein
MSLLHFLFVLGARLGNSQALAEREPKDCAIPEFRGKVPCTP